MHRNQDTLQGWKLEGEQLKPVHSVTNYTYSLLFLEAEFEPGVRLM